MEGVIGYEKAIIALAAALALGLSAIATAWAQSRIGAAGAGTLAEYQEALRSVTFSSTSASTASTLLATPRDMKNMSAMTLKNNSIACFSGGTPMRAVLIDLGS